MNFNNITKCWGGQAKAKALTSSFQHFEVGGR